MRDFLSEWENVPHVPRHDEEARRNCNNEKFTDGWISILLHKLYLTSPSTELLFSLNCQFKLL